jgi:Ca2+-dependent lipid-binding protein
MPYIGSAGISLIEPPFVEFELPVHALGGLDILALPGIRGLFRMGLRLASRQFLVYPK